MARASRRQFHYIYKTTRITDGKFYVGMHSTDDMNDEYMGSGTRITRSIKKYGIENHIKEILFVLPDRFHLCEKEKEVIKSFEDDSLCMNISKGGDGGWDHVNESGLCPLHQKLSDMPEHVREAVLAAKRKGNAHPSRREKNIRRLGDGMFGKKHSDESKKKMSESQTGERNSQFGKVWVVNISGESMKRDPDDARLLVEKGSWQYGRKWKNAPVVQR